MLLAITSANHLEPSPHNAFRACPAPGPRPAVDAPRIIAHVVLRPLYCWGCSNDVFDASMGVDGAKVESIVNITGNRLGCLWVANAFLAGGLTLLGRAIWQAVSSSPVPVTCPTRPTSTPCIRLHHSPSPSPALRHQCQPAPGLCS